MTEWNIVCSAFNSHNLPLICFVPSSCLLALHTTMPHTQTGRKREKATLRAVQALKQVFVHGMTYTVAISFLISINELITMLNTTPSEKQMLNISLLSFAKKTFQCPYGTKGLLLHRLCPFDCPTVQFISHDSLVDIMFIILSS